MCLNVSVGGRSTHTPILYNDWAPGPQDLAFSDKDLRILPKIARLRDCRNFGCSLRLLSTIRRVSQFLQAAQRVARESEVLQIKTKWARPSPHWESGWLQINPIDMEYNFGWSAVTLESLSIDCLVNGSTNFALYSCELLPLDRAILFLKKMASHAGYA